MFDRTEGLLDRVASISVRRGRVPGRVRYRLKSGGVFEYTLAPYRVRPGMTEADADTLSRRVLAERGFFCEWGRAQLDNDTLEEIRLAVRSEILEVARRMRHARQLEATTDARVSDAVHSVGA